MSTDSSSASPIAALGIQKTEINSAPGVSLDATQKLLVGSVLDLFAGQPTLKKLQLWKDDAVFEDPLTISTGRKQYEAQWYGLQAGFSNIDQLSHLVTDAGNPIKLDLSSKYKVKGIGTEQKIDSVINIFYDQTSGKIEKVEDRWNDELPEGELKEMEEQKGKAKGKKQKSGAASKKDSDADLAALIQQRQKQRSANFLDDLEAKYGGGKKGTKRKSAEPPEEAFAATAARASKRQTKRGK